MNTVKISKHETNTLLYSETKNFIDNLAIKILFIGNLKICIIKEMYIISCT